MQLSAFLLKGRLSPGVLLSAVVLLTTVVLLSTAGCKSAADSGAVLYEKACARCHGTDGKGGITSSETAGVASRDLSDPAWQKIVTDDELRTVVRDGRRKMPAFGHLLSIDKIDLVVKHLRTFVGTTAGAAPAAPNTPAATATPADPYAAPTAAPR